MTIKVQRLLIIDDDDGIRHSLARIFRGLGLEVELAADGESAVSIARQFEPDCVLADVRLPGIDGPTTCRLIREHLPHVDTIFMTAYTAARESSQQLRLTAHLSDASQSGDSPADSATSPRRLPCWLGKPLDVEQLISQVKALHLGGTCE